MPRPKGLNQIQEPAVVDSARHALEVLEEEQRTQSEQLEQREYSGHSEQRNHKPRKRRERLTVQVDVELIERVKDAVYWTHRETLAAFAERAFKAEITRMETERLEPFPKRVGELQPGRPLR
ncbi:MAG: hypothetical protein ACYC0V_08180 [Armatimonadota bacterium]